MAAGGYFSSESVILQVITDLADQFLVVAKEFRLFSLPVTLQMLRRPHGEKEGPARRDLEAPARRLVEIPLGDEAKTDLRPLQRTNVLLTLQMPDLT